MTYAIRIGIWLAAAVLATTAGCVDNPVQTQDLDHAFYRCKVQPILDHSCSALACHGKLERPFHVFTRNRLRLIETSSDQNTPLTPGELDANFDNARGFAGAPADESWLLLKPLEQHAGGYFHKGKDLFDGPDVWTSREDDDFVTVLAWLRGEKADPDCVYPGFR